MEKYQLTYHVDMVFCIDATGSMRHVLDFVKRNALNLYQDVAGAMEKKRKTVSQMRIRVIAFRDYVADGEQAMMASDFFVLPQQAQQFYDCVNGITAKGGGDIPEDGLEALAYAIRSDWTREGVKKRHIIVVWSDAPTHELGYGKIAPWYPEGMAEDFDELSLWWEDEQLGGAMDEGAKRLLIFAPDAPEWNRISSEWSQVVHVQTVSEGLAELEYQQVIDAVCNTI
ncbi:MAG TPA: vWA domain-containing protein [Candidatus Limiplasma sp.]|nr:vWA domain-containing protein [Candidatus Limiplasma sp.]HPS80577.1 vWA domain-containing protein [Candidatus Limiplasma sp.]